MNSAMTYGFSLLSPPGGKYWLVLSGCWAEGPPSATEAAVDRPPSFAVPPTPGAGFEVDMVVDVCDSCLEGLQNYALILLTSN